MNVVSLLPAATDIVAALGAADRLVAVTHECDSPAAAALPRVTSSPIEVGLPAGVVDAHVREAAAAGEPLFVLDDSLIAALRPDLLLTQALCEVCAVSETDVRALAARLAPAPRIVTLSGTTLDSVFHDVERVAAALALPGEGAALIAALRARLERVHQTLKAAAAPRPRVAVIEWTDPVFAAGHWVPEMVRRAGGVDVLARAGEHSVVRTVDEIAAADPELLLFAPCGYDAHRAAAEARATLDRPEWRWAAGRRAWAVDANVYVSRPGPRLADGVELFAAIMHPELFGEPGEERAVACSG